MRSKTPRKRSPRNKSPLFPGLPDEVIRLQFSALNATQNAIVITERDGTIEWVNPAFEQVTGYTASDVIGKTPRVLKSNVHDGAFYQRLWKTILSGKVWRSEIVNRRKDGTLYTELETITPVKGPDDTIAHFISVKQDITQRKKAEEELRLFRSLIDQTNDGIEIIDPATGTFLDVNERTLTSLGYTREEMLSLTVADVDPTVRPEEFGRYIEALRSKQTMTHEGQHRRKDGTVFPVEVAIRFARLGREYLVTIVRDISDRKKGEADLRESEERFRLLAESSLAGIYLMQGNTFTYANRAFASMFGYTIDEIAGRLGPADLVYPDDRELVLGNIRRRLLGEVQEARYEFRGWRKDRTIVHVEVHGRRIDFGDGVGIIGTVVDISARKRAESELFRKHRALTTLSNFNQALVRATDEQTLLNETCRVCVEDGGYRMVWVGVAEKDAARSIHPVAQAGFEDGYLETLHLTWSDTPRGRGPTGTAIRTGRPSVQRNIPDDPSFALWREAAVRRGYASSVALPLVTSSGVIGALNIYATDIDAFDQAEVDLLTELASDLAYGITSVRVRAERKAGEEALRASEEKFRLLITQMDLGLAVHEAVYDATGNMVDYRFLDLNASFERMTGLSRDRVIGRTVKEVLPGIEPMWIERYANVVRTGASAHFQNYAADLGRYYEVVAYRNREHQFAVVVSDVSVRKRMEAELQENEKRYRSISEMISDYAYAFKVQEDGSLTREWIVGGFEKITGYRPEELDVTGGWQLLVHPDERSGASDRFQRLLEGHEYVREFRIVRKDGTVRWLQDAARPERSQENGRVVRIVGAARDVTEERLAAEEIDRSHERYERFFMEDLTGDFISTPEGRIIACNPAFVKMFGFNSMRDAVQTEIQQLFRSQADFAQMVARLRREGRLEDLEVDLVKKDGTRLYAIANLIGRFDAEGEITEVQGYLFDNTRRRELEESLRQTQKLESIGTLASGIAHDFNNILGIILGHASILEDPAIARERHAASVETINRATQRGVGLVRQLLTFARKTESVFEAVSVNDLVREIVVFMRETFPKTISVVTELGDGLPVVTADATQVHQVLLNLCVNARDAMEKGGTIGISTRAVSGGEVSRTHAEARAAQYVLIAVGDTGPGIEKGVREKLFEPFFTTKEKGKGTGLGLAVVHGIVRSHGGFIGVESVPGKGATFQVYFPVGDPGELQLKPTSLRVSDLAGGTETILLAEDEEPLREMMADLLRGKGYTVMAAKDGKEALEMFDLHSSTIDLVLSDMGLPFLGGEDVFRHVQRMRPGTKVILSTGFVEPSVRSGLMKEGVREFLLKPFTPSDVLLKVRRGLGEGREK